MTTPEPAAPLTPDSIALTVPCPDCYLGKTPGQPCNSRGGALGYVHRSRVDAALVFYEAEVQRLRSEVAAARNVTLREVLAYEAGQGASIPADLEAAARLDDGEVYDAGSVGGWEHALPEQLVPRGGHWRRVADAQLAKALRLAGARMRALEQVHALVVQGFFKGTASGEPEWRSCRLCSWTWRAGAKEVHEATCPMNALLAPEATDGA